MLWSDSIAFLCSVSIVVLLVTGKLQIWHIYIVNSITGFMGAFQSPASSVALGMIVPEDKLSNASGMNSLSSSILSVITPMLAAFINSIFGLKGVIMIDMLTFGFAFCVLLFYIKLPEVLKKVPKSKNEILKGCKEGFSFLFEHKGLWNLIVSMAVINFFSRITFENILPAMLLARSGGNDNVFGVISGLLGFGGILGGLYVSFFKLPKNNIKLIYFSAALSFIMGDLLMGVGQNIWLWGIAGLFASVPIPFVSAGQNVILYRDISKEMQGRVFAVRNAMQFVTIPIGILLGGFLADSVFEPFMQSSNPVALVLQRIVGTGAGSGMAAMFLFTGISGCVTSMIWYRNREIRRLNEKLE